MVQVNFGNFKEYDVNNRFFNPNLADGALLDIGVYAVSFARWFMTSKPNTSLTTMTPLETGVDESSGILLQNKDMEEYVTNLSGEQNLEYIQDVRDVLTQVQKVWGKYE